MPVTGTWLPMSADVRAAVRAARLSLPFARRNAVRLVPAVLVAIIVVLVLLGVPAITAIGGPLALVLVGPWLEDRGAWVRGGPYIKHSTEATVDGTGLRYRGNGVLAFDQTWPWDRFRYAVETRDQFVFVGLRNKAGFVPYVPKRAVDVDALRAAIPIQVRPGG